MAGESEGREGKRIVPGSFRLMLEQMSGGELLLELDEKLAKARDHAVQTGAPAKITLSFDFKREGDTWPARVDVQPKVTVSFAERKRAAMPMYEQDDGSLSRRDPRQPSLFGDGKDGQGGGQGAQPAQGQGTDGKPLKN